MILTVDTRESERVRTRLYVRKIPHKMQTLTVGDFQNENENVIVENKRPEDIWGRVINKENGWDDQMSRLSEYCYERGIMPWLVVEGTMDDAIRRTHGKIHVPEVRGAIASASVRYGIAVFHCEGKNDEGDSLDNLINTVVAICEKGDRELGQPRQLPFSRVAMDKRAAILMNVCHVSGTQAKNLLQHFGSIRSVLLSTENQLEIVDGIGHMTAKKICQYKDSV